MTGKLTLAVILSQATVIFGFAELYCEQARSYICLWQVVIPRLQYTKIYLKRLFVLAFNALL